MMKGKLTIRSLLIICGLGLLACWPFPGDDQKESLVLYSLFDKEVVVMQIKSGICLSIRITVKFQASQNGARAKLERP